MLATANAGGALEIFVVDAQKQQVWHAYQTGQYVPSWIWIGGRFYQLSKFVLTG
jgi:hypothetical protein